MKRVWGHVLAALSLVGGVATAFSACVHDDSTIFVQSVLAPQTSSQPETPCTYTADPTEPFLSSGVLDLALRTEYDAVFLLGNQMASQANSSQLQTETSFVNITHAIVRITTADGQELATYTRLTAATIPPASGNTPGFSTIGAVEVIDGTTLGGPAVQQNLVPGGSVRLVTNVRFAGTSLGGESVESNEFQFPVDICIGCLIGFTNNPVCPVPNCVGNPGASTTASQPLIPCGNNIGQDLPIDCNTCSNMGYGSCRGAYQGAPGTTCAPVVDAGGD